MRALETWLKHHNKHQEDVIAQTDVHKNNEAMTINHPTKKKCASPISSSAQKYVYVTCVYKTLK